MTATTALFLLMQLAHLTYVTLADIDNKRRTAQRKAPEGFTRHCIVALNGQEHPTLISDSAAIAQHLHHNRPRIRVSILGDSMAQGVGVQKFTDSFPYLLKSFVCCAALSGGHECP